jgi:hypothetical protein
MFKSIDKDWKEQDEYVNGLGIPLAKNKEVDQMVLHLNFWITRNHKIFLSQTQSWATFAISFFTSNPDHSFIIYTLPIYDTGILSSVYDFALSLNPKAQLTQISLWLTLSSWARCL